MATSPDRVTPRGRVRRRTGRQVQTLLIEAAQEIFATEGYSGATTRDIAAKAGVSDVLIYRHFGSKRGLFEKAVREPVDVFVREYAATWAEHEAGTEPTETLITRWIAGLYPLLRKNRGLLMALVMAQESNDVDDDTGVARITDLLQPIVDLTAAEGLKHNFTDVEAELTVKVAFGMTLGVVLLEEHVFGTGSHVPSRRKLSREMEMFIHHRVWFAPLSSQGDTQQTDHRGQEKYS